MQNPSAAKIVLASSSVYRQRLLDRVLDDYETVTPGVDESADIDDPEELAAFLARQKAEAVSSAYRDALIIGADQLAVLDGQILGKPGDHQKAVEQLLQASGKAVQNTWIKPSSAFAPSTGAWPKPT
jgi:predicted house-cleaning NTP pyrophosphatase (Maf/HAM1 superfamily)